MGTPMSQDAGSVIAWLLDADPSIRWQVMRDLTDAPAEIVAAERSRVASRGMGRATARPTAPRRPVGRRRRHAVLVVEHVHARIPARPWARSRERTRARPRSISCATTSRGDRSSATRHSSRAKSSRASTAASSRLARTSASAAIGSSIDCWANSSRTAAGIARPSAARCARRSTRRSACSKDCSRSSRRSARRRR